MYNLFECSNFCSFYFPMYYNWGEPHTSDVNRDFSDYIIYLPYVSSNYMHYLKIALTTFTVPTARAN